jgi:hypothetical protein
MARDIYSVALHPFAAPVSARPSASQNPSARTFASVFPSGRSMWRRGTGIEPAWNAATRSTLDLKSRPGTSRGNLAVTDPSAPIPG